MRRSCGAPKAERSKGRRTSSCARATHGDDRCGGAHAAPCVVRHREARRARAAPDRCRDGSRIRGEVAVMKITVAALMTTPWIARFLEVPAGTDLVLIPRLCEGDPTVIAQRVGVPVEKGPKDLRQIPEYFWRAALARDYGGYDIEIVAEVNNAPRLARQAIRCEA